MPAESLRLTCVDAIFVRMGARDQLMTGQSTFFVELAETAAMLQRATARWGQRGGGGYSHVRLLACCMPSYPFKPY